MMALLSRVYTLIVPVAVGTAVFFSGSMDLRGDDVPSLQKENGPYMVLARVFRGPDAEKYAKALTSELRQEYKLPAYIYQRFPKGVGPFEEIAVLVGDAKTLKDSKAILKQVKAMNPHCLADIPPIYFRPRLSGAFCTTNPLLPAEKPPIKQR
jgi:hypothetical protein